MHFRQIDAFRAVMLSGTATQAARLLETSQPAISRLIAELEATMGLTLFTRARGRLIPTEEAKAFFIEVEKSYLGLDHLRRFSVSLRQSPGMHLQIGSVMSFALDFLPRVITRFRKLDPQARVSLGTAQSVPIRDRVAAHLFDIGLANDIVDVSGVEATSFARDALVVALPAGHALAERPVLGPKDLAGTPLISFAPEILMRTGVAAAFEAAGVPLALSVDSPYSALLCNLVRDGAGLGIVHPFSALDFLGRGLVIRRFSAPSAMHTLLLVPQRASQPQQVDAFIRLLRTMRDETARRIEAALNAPANAQANWASEVT